MGSAKMEQTTQHDATASSDGKSAVAVDAPGAPSPPSRRRKIIRWGIAGLVVLALAFGIPPFLRSLSHESTDDAFIDGNIVPVSPRVAGHVTRVFVQDNQWVKAGDLLVELDASDFKTRLDAAKATLEAAKAADRGQKIMVALTRITAAARLDEARGDVQAVKAAVREAMARLALSNAALDQVRAEADSVNVRHCLDAMDLKRYREGVKTNSVSLQDLDHAKAAEQISAATLTAAKKKIDTQKAKVREAAAGLKAVEANLHQADARLTAAQPVSQRIRQMRSRADVSGADIDKAAAELAQARLNLSYTKIYAPCDGFVTKKGVEPGQFVQAGQPLLAIVPRAIWVTANFKETQLTHMRSGQSVEITVDAYPDLTFHGHVDSIQRGTGARFSLLPPENATGNYVKVVQRVPVKIVFDRSQEISRVLLAPGMSVVPDVDVGAWGAPGGALKQSPGNKVLTPAKDGAADGP